MTAGWIQHRETESPKEYHYDSALTWCRENGWTQEELGNCPFYPQIGSIFYLTATGGPTGIYPFEQWILFLFTCIFVAYIPHILVTANVFVANLLLIQLVCR
jgi:hypothetical protein